MARTGHGALVNFILRGAGAHTASGVPLGLTSIHRPIHTRRFAPAHREVFFNDPASSQGRVYAGTVFDRPSADWLQIRFQDFSIKKPSDLER